MTSQLVPCGAMIFQDQSDRCELPMGHQGDHGFLPRRVNISIRPYMHEVTQHEEDATFKTIQYGAFSFAVPNQIAEIIAAALEISRLDIHEDPTSTIYLAAHLKQIVERPQ